MVAVCSCRVAGNLLVKSACFYQFSKTDYALLLRYKFFALDNLKSLNLKQIGSGLESLFLDNICTDTD